MKLKVWLSLLLFFAVSANGQQHNQSSLHLGDTAPPLKVQKWLKGKPIPYFRKGKIYVIDFWATWCRPCKAAMPHISALAQEFKNKATFLAIDVYEKKISINKIKKLVTNMGRRMDFTVAIEKEKYMTQNWIEASSENSIPSIFIINGQGKLAWIGHPKDAKEVLVKILNSTWDIKKASDKRNFDRYLAGLDSDAGSILHSYNGDYYKLEDLGKPDSALLIINEMVRKEPQLKYAPVVAYFTFSALLKTNTCKAKEYGRNVMSTSTYDTPAYDVIIGAIRDSERKLKIPPEIYKLGAECYQKQVISAPYPELLNLSDKYSKMASWYLLSGDKINALKAEKKASQFSSKLISED